MNRNILNGWAERARLWARRHALPIFIISLTVGMTAILSFDLPGSSQIDLTVGQPAPNDIFSPRSITYNSDLLTRQARDQASRAVPEVYSSLDLSLGRGQLTKARDVFAFIDTVRADSSASVERRLEYLRAIEGISISDEVGRTILELGQAEFQSVADNIFSIIEELMRQEIRPAQLNDFQRTARRLAGLDLTAAQTAVVTEVAYQFIVSNIFPDEEATAAARNAAAAAIQPVTRTVARDQRIIRAGEIVTEIDNELLGELGLLQRRTNWWHALSMALASTFFVGLIATYWVRFQRAQFPNGRYLGVLGGLLLLFVLAGKILAADDMLVYWFPIAALSLVLAVVYDTRFAILVTVLMAALIGFIRPNSLEVAVFLAAGGIISILTLKDSQRMTAFFRAGIWAAIGYIAAIVAFWLLSTVDPDPLDIALPALYAVGNGMISSALTLVGFYILGSLFGIVTILQLQDLSRLDHPLLRELLRRAPGTYHHSIMVANLAEQAAERIGANSTLVRVSAFYHDVGKMVRPPFFVENQEGIDPHATLDPYTSARIVISHVADGMTLARQFHLPFRVQAIIAEHHGTRVVRSFFRKAEEAAGGQGLTDVALFRYPGPRPGSRESAIVMLADAIDATSTAVRPNTEKAIEKLVSTIVEDDILEGQLNHSGLSLGDIEQLRASFIETLKGRFHVRVQYPGNELLMVENMPEFALPAPATSLPEPLTRAPQTVSSS